MARTILSQSRAFTKKDFINSRNGMALQEVAGETLKIVSCAIILDDSDEDGEKKIGTIITESEVFTTISENIIQSIEDIIEIEADGETDIQVRISKRKSKAGRDFLTMTID